MAKKAATIQRTWDRINAASVKLADRVHRAAMDTLEHYSAHGDTSLCSYAVNSLWKSGVNRRALIQFFERFGRMNLVVLTEGKVSFVKKTGADHTTIDLDKADASPYYADETLDGKTGKDNKSFNLLGIVKNGLTKADKIVEENYVGYDKEKVDFGSDDFRTELSILVEKYSAANDNKPQQDTVYDGALRKVG